VATYGLESNGATCCDNVAVTDCQLALQDGAHVNAIPFVDASDREIALVDIEAPFVHIRR
jgi:hypothetical protein